MSRDIFFCIKSSDLNYRRHISEIAFSRDFGRQMRFIIGPRQTGKTTAAKEFLKEQNCLKLYYNWDDRKTRDRYIADYH